MRQILVALFFRGKLVKHGNTTTSNAELAELAEHVVLRILRFLR
jgi:hypothetical protein